MQFSEYTIVARPEHSIDPLGLTQPFSALRNRLYAQFTVLSNAPAYHGVLTLIYQLLAERKITPGQEGFSRRFREAECLWGLACVVAGSSVLNVTKYEAILEGRDSLRLADVGRGNAVFRSLAYGSLGHYSNPSMAWGLLERGGVRLTPLGGRLAERFAARGKQSLREAMVAWLDGETLTRQALEALGQAYGLDSPAPSSERHVWEEAVAGWVLRVPQCRTLWDSPPDQAELDDLRARPAHYREFFPTLAARYPLLADVFGRARRFETMSALCLFIFTREYLLCHDAGPDLPTAGSLEQGLAAALATLAQEALALPGPHPSQDWMTALAVASSYDAAAAVIVQHHIRHQQAKGAQPYMEGGRLRVRERFDRQSFTSMYEELCNQPDTAAQVDLLTHSHRRDWHFDRALRYLRYFRGNT